MSMQRLAACLELIRLKLNRDLEICIIRNNGSFVLHHELRIVAVQKISLAFALIVINERLQPGM
jgi:hypothetical protein